MKLSKKTISSVLALSMALGTGALFPVTAHAEPYNWALLPDWVPTDFDSAMDFRNSYGVSRIDNGFICIVERLSDAEQMYCDIQTSGTERPDEVIGAGYQAKKFTFEYKLPEEPDKSDAKAYAEYESAMRRLEYTSIPEHGPGFHYEALVIYADDDKNFDVEVGITDSQSDKRPEETYTYSFLNDGKNSKETDIYGWLPDCVPEHDQFVEEYGNITYINGLLVYCDDVNYSTGASLNKEFSGEGKLKQLPCGHIVRDYLIQPSGGTSFFANVYTGEAPGAVDVSFIKGRSWEASENKTVLKTSAVVDEDLNVHEYMHVTIPKIIPDWIPQDSDSLIEFIDTHGSTWVQDGIICHVRKVSADSENDYPINYGGSTADNISEYISFQKKIDDPESGYYKFVVTAFNIPDNSDLLIKEDYGSNPNYAYTLKTFSFSKDSTGYITQHDIYSWLPDCDEEFNAYYEKHGAFSVQGEYVMFCTNKSIDKTELTYDQTGSGLFIEHLQESFMKYEDNYRDGGSKHIIKLFKPVREGNVKLDLYNQSYNYQKGGYETSDHETACFNIDKDLRITPAEEKDIKSNIKGDCNGDGILGISDVIVLQNWLHGKKSLDETGMADANGDGVVDVFDLIVLKKKVIASMSEAPRPVMAIVEQNFAWSAFQNANIYDQYGNCYNFNYSSRNDDSYRTGNVLLRMDADDWYEQVKEIMDKANANPNPSPNEKNKGDGSKVYGRYYGSLPDGAVKAINSFAKKSAEYSKQKMVSRAAGCDMGEKYLYIIDTTNDDPVYALLAEFGDAEGWIPTEECQDFIKTLSEYNIYGSGLVRDMNGERLFY